MAKEKERGVRGERERGGEERRECRRGWLERAIGDRERGRRVVKEREREREETGVAGER